MHLSPNCIVSIPYAMFPNHLSLLASLSLSISSSTSPTRTGPFTLRMRCLLSASFPEMRMTLTCVMPPREPVLPSSCVTLALTGYDYMAIIILLNYSKSLHGLERIRGRRPRTDLPSTGTRALWMEAAIVGDGVKLGSRDDLPGYSSSGDFCELDFLYSEPICEQGVFPSQEWMRRVWIGLQSGGVCLGEGFCPCGLEVDGLAALVFEELALVVAEDDIRPLLPLLHSPTHLFHQGCEPSLHLPIPLPSLLLPSRLLLETVGDEE